MEHQVALLINRIYRVQREVEEGKANRRDLQKEVLELFTKLGAVITESHVVYTSGLHGTVYINKDALYPNTFVISSLCKMLARPFTHKADVVIAPAVGGVILSQWTAHALTNGSEQHTVLSLYAEKDELSFVIKRGYDRLIEGKRVLVVEDVLTTGESVRKVVKAVRERGGEVIGVSALCNRGAVTPKALGDVPELFSLLELNLETWAASDCLPCRNGVPVNTQVGKGLKFLQAK